MDRACGHKAHDTGVSPRVSHLQPLLHVRASFSFFMLSVLWEELLFKWSSKSPWTHLAAQEGWPRFLNTWLTPKSHGFYNLSGTILVSALFILIYVWERTLSKEHRPGKWYGPTILSYIWGASLFWIFFFFYLKYLCPTYHKVEGRERRRRLSQKVPDLGSEAWLQGPEQVLSLSGKEGAGLGDLWSSELGETI